MAPRCRQIAGIVKSFLRANYVQLILFKGGTMEKDLADELCYQWKNLEDWKVKKAPVHDPLLEVRFFQFELERLTIEEEENH